MQKLHISYNTNNSSLNENEQLRKVTNLKTILNIYCKFTNPSIAEFWFKYITVVETNQILRGLVGSVRHFLCLLIRLDNMFRYVKYDLHINMHTQDINCCRTSKQDKKAPEPITGLAIVIVFHVQRTNHERS